MTKYPWLTVLRRILTWSLASAAALPVSAVDALPKDESRAARAPRERISLNADWRFTLGDPAGNTVGLDYDVRPEVKDERDDAAADSKPKEAEAVSATKPVLKPWILPTGNVFLKDAARRHARPEGNPGQDVAYAHGDFDDRSWRRLDLPHDWAIEGPFIPTGSGGGMGRLPNAAIAWYRKKLDIPASDAGRPFFLEIDGAMSYAVVFLNGHLVGGWPYGYTSWQVDLTPYVKPGGVNQLAIRLDNPGHSSRWYPGGGIYRNVWLTKTQPVHVAQWGTSVTTRQVSATVATVDVAVTIANASNQAVEVQVSTDILALDETGRRTGAPVARIAGVTTQAAPAELSHVSGSVDVQSPRLWGPPPEQKPHRYVAVTTVTRGAEVVDVYETPFGIRSLRFDPDWGLYVNGQRVRIQGVNQHHDLGALGAAFNVRAAERQLELLREMGCNAIRMAHNPPARELLELTDRMGFLIVDEVFDCWYRKKTPLDFHLIFADWHEQDLRAMLRRDRNHPSVIMWSVGNEVGEQYTDAEGAEVARRLCAIAHEEDPTRPATASMNWAKAHMPFPAALDLISLNYQGEGIRDIPMFEGTERIRTPPSYPTFRARFPEKMIVSSESASAFSSRGVYLFPVAKEVSGPVRDGYGGDSKIAQVSAYEQHAADFGSSADKVFRSLDRHGYVAGEFVWSGWDYLGEPTPYYSARSSYCGIIDLAGFKKDRFYLYQARWRPDLPMAHILPHWTWPERVGQMTPVHVFTSGDEAELFLNGRSLGRKKRGEYEYRFRWDEVVYEPGILNVVTYREGKPWAKAEVRTAHAAAALKVEVDRREIAADGRDLAFVTVQVVDRDGNPVPRADPSIHFTVEGPGEIVATDNGDATSFESFQSPRRKAFNGLCLAIVRAKPGQRAAIRIQASATDLAPATVEIRPL